MLDYLMYFISKIYYQPIVKKVLKLSMMGNIHDKTVDYYRSINMITHEIEEEFKFHYTYCGNHYILATTSVKYNEAIDYIISCNIPIVESNVLFAYTRTPEGAIEDITETIRKYEGPSADFNHSTSFFILADQISEHPMYILTTNMNMFKFEGSDIVYLENSSLNITDYFHQIENLRAGL